MKPQKIPPQNASAVVLNQPPRLSVHNFRRLAQFIQDELGIQMPESKLLMLETRLAPRARQLGLSSLDDYCVRLFTPSLTAVERVHLVSAVTTNKTDFFREPQHFSQLTKVILPRLEGIRSTTLRVWSAACASGEEPYSLAMVLSEYGELNRGFSFQILATDISDKVLRMAKEGIYATAQGTPVPAELRKKYFLAGVGRRAGQIRVAPSLRRLVTFSELNLMDKHYQVQGKFELIFCRNVLIYFDRPTQKQVAERLIRHLVPGGYLFIGHSESLSGLDLPLVAAGPSCFRVGVAVERPVLSRQEDVPCP